MKSKRAAAVLGSVAIGMSTVAWGPPSAVADLGAPEFTLKAVTIAEHYDDVGRKGESIGDTLVFSEKLFHAGDRVGRAAVTCSVIDAGKSSIRLLCSATLTLRGHGDLNVHGKVVFREGSKRLPVLAVTGGTGDYTGATGTMTLRESNRTSRYDIALTG